MYQLERELQVVEIPPLRASYTVQVLLPAYNEAEALPVMLRAIDENLRRLQIPYHVTVVNDGSSDDTAELAHEAMDHFPVSLVSHPFNLGLAAAMRSGLERLADESGLDDIIITMDCDNTHPIGLIPRMVGMIHEGHDVVVASRFRPQSRVLGVSPFRRMTARCAALLFRCLLPIPGIRDYTCGFRAYRADALRLALETYGTNLISEQGFTCMVDMLIKMSRLNLICGETPMILRYDLKSGPSKMPVRQTIAETLRLALKRRMGVLD